mmetsp:Transcript_49961/g.116210  ORF Transcript_49961/g.116210 Transcript_49961/m.116210 type:complete len:388 (+) Transcript_49961:93-1256(+)|eukprot:CAMPEP_0176196824 /NCGR_PEP_ID=MMETSP0121_2-20121125/7227_1 /TAXON_ID=160619 /ORGANISM="Kryptoperidinium foliaceum, Strain CCMP 1326" /LENGTH=387 /DNA_ID=CAMNT_0017535637 /DNA_START=136 /DNA_END=1299 /DNA_ORIENTATION=+
MVAAMATENRIRHSGILNLGNTGYIEVSLQTLYHCTEFREMILSLDLNGEPRDDPWIFQMVRELQGIYQQWQKLENVLPPAEDPTGLVQHDVLRLVYAHINPFIGPIGYVDPTKFVEAVQKCITLRHPVDQPNDAQQFYCTFIRKLQLFFQMERTPNSARATFRRMFITPQSKSKRCCRCSEMLPGSNVLLKVGSLAYCFDCTVATIEPSGPEQHNNVTPLLAKALREGDVYAGVESENRCSCSPNQVVSARITVQPVYTRLPDLLAVRFKRWPVSNRNAYFEFDEYIDLTHLLDQGQQEYPLLYRLLSVVVHHGNTSGYGRYFSYIRCNGGDQWARFWNTDVIPVNWETIQRESFGGHHDGKPSSDITNVAYMLHYEKVRPRPATT